MIFILKDWKRWGRKIQLEEGYVHGTAKKLKGVHHIFESVTVTGTMNVMMAAALAEGETILENAAREPEVTFLVRRVESIPEPKSKAPERTRSLFRGCRPLNRLIAGFFPTGLKRQPT